MLRYHRDNNKSVLKLLIRCLNNKRPLIHTKDNESIISNLNHNPLNIWINSTNINNTENKQ